MKYTHCYHCNSKLYAGTQTVTDKYGRVFCDFECAVSFHEGTEHGIFSRELLTDYLNDFEWHEGQENIMKTSFDGGKANYYCAGGIEAQDVIEAFELNFSRGSALKYLLRAGRKTDDEVRDLEKARAYIDREIARLKAADLEGLARREAQA